MKRVFLGDIHGDFDRIRRTINRFREIEPNVIGVGDIGLGFQPVVNLRTGKLFDKSDPESFPSCFRFIRGNHDNPEACKTYSNYMGDFGVDEETGIFFVSGAESYDRNLRTAGIDWWSDEELSYRQMDEAIQLYLKIRPNVVLSHTCPAEIARQFARSTQAPRSRTEVALQMMFNAHRPKLWIFGHWHVMWDKTIASTRFVCCAINQSKLLEI